MKQKTFENYFFRMIKELSKLGSAVRSIKVFNILEKYKAKLEKYSVNVSRNFPKVDVGYYCIKATDSYHFTNPGQSIDIFIVLFEPKYSDKHLVRIIIEYTDGNPHPITFILKDFELE
jgi:hypothetical protein